MCADDVTVFCENINTLKRNKGTLDVVKMLVWQ